jgi:hypothetical protein
MYITTTNCPPTSFDAYVKNAVSLSGEEMIGCEEFLSFQSKYVVPTFNYVIVV